MTQEEKKILKDYFSAIDLDSFEKEEKFRIMRACIYWVTQSGFVKKSYIFPFLGKNVTQKLTPLPIK